MDRGLAPPTPRVRAVITAGGTVRGAFAQALGTPVKALAPFGTGTLLDVALGPAPRPASTASRSSAAPRCGPTSPGAACG